MSLVERLASHRITGTLPREEMEWVAAHGQLRRLETGDVLSARAAGPVTGLFIILSGQISLQVTRANGREKVMEWQAGDITGVLPYSRLGAPPGDTTAEMPTELIAIPREDLPALIRECHAFTSALVHVMLDRARHFTSSDLHAEKMASLGKLSAGLAHELNNPAAAIIRSARSLHRAIRASEDATQALGALSLTAEQCAAIDGIRSKVAQSGTKVVRSPLELADREAELEAWLRNHDAETEDTGLLVESGITEQILDELAVNLDGGQLKSAIRWLAAGCLTRELTGEITQAATRISNLVDAVKGFTQMDLSATAGPVDLSEGLNQTLTIHSGKASVKGAAINLSIAPGLPRARGMAGELNQVWSNPIDNALDSVGPGGTVTIAASTDGRQIVVEVIDDGPGIPAEIRGRIFDPFFTTKNVGQGTGLGLDIVKRIILKHQGTINVESRPGHTVFKVTLPLATRGVGA
jgi:signal transduction histidine kinase